jgi:hypothetical protein
MTSIDAIKKCLEALDSVDVILIEEHGLGELSRRTSVNLIKILTALEGKKEMQVIDEIIK